MSIVWIALYEVMFNQENCYIEDQNLGCGIEYVARRVLPQ